MPLSKKLTIKLFALFFLFFAPLTSYAQKDPDVLNVSLIKPMSDFQPFVEPTSQSMYMAYALHDGLFVGDKNGNIVKSLATDWKTSHEGKHHHFTIRDDAKWSDGSRLVAEDFARGLRILLNPEINIYMQKNWSPLVGFDLYRNQPEDPSVLGIRVKSDTQFTLMLTKPNPFIQYMFSSPNLVPFPPAAENPTYWDNPEAQLFSGRYKINQPLDEFPIRLKRNPYYTGKQTLIYDSIHIYRHHKKQDFPVLIEKLREGSLDIALKMPGDSLILKDVHQDIFITQQTLSSDYAVLNTKKAPLNQTETRRLFQRVINMTKSLKRINTNNKDDNKLANYFIPKKLGGIPQKPYVQEVINESRRALIKRLKTLGYSKDNNLPIKILTSSSTSIGVKQSRYICDQIIDREGIIDCQIKISKSYKDYREERKKRNYHFIFAGWGLDTPHPVDLLNVFTTGHSSNHALWSDLAYDQMIEAIKSEQNPAKALELSNKAEAYFLKQSVVLPHYSNQPDVHGLAPDLERQLPVVGGEIIDFVATRRSNYKQ